MSKEIKPLNPRGLLSVKKYKANKKRKKTLRKEKNKKIKFKLNVNRHVLVYNITIDIAFKPLEMEADGEAIIVCIGFTITSRHFIYKMMRCNCQSNKVIL